MYLNDYHTHTLLSRDSEATLAEMADAGLAAGLEEMCFTDHVDLLDTRGVPLTSHDWAPKVEQFKAVAPWYTGRIRLRMGLEFGMGFLNPALSDQIIAQPALDFVIGSVHNQDPAHGGLDFYYMEYKCLADCQAALDDYFDSMVRLSTTDYYDVLGHIIYPLRYMHMEIPMKPYRERLEAMLRNAVERGRGIEVNTYRGKTIREWRPVLELYRACGGEIVTVGSDAHKPEYVGLGVAEACELLADVGFRYVATYRGRKPSFHKL